MKTRSPFVPFEDRTAIALNRDRSSCETLRSGRSKGDDKSGVDRFDFVKQPTPAYLDLASVGTLVQPSLAARLELEMLDRIGHVNALAVHARLDQRLVQQKTRRPDERAAFAVFSISRLLADEHDLGVLADLLRIRFGSRLSTTDRPDRMPPRDANSQSCRSPAGTALTLMA